MVKLSRGDVVRVRDGGKAIILDVYPHDVGAWAMYRNPVGDVDCRGYARQFIGEIIGHISLDTIEGALRNGE